MSEPNVPEVPEEVALFQNEVKVGPYTVKPWTLKQLNGVYPLLRVILGKLQEKGLTFENAETYFAEHGLEIIQDLLPLLPELIALTLRLELSEAEDMPWDRAGGLALHIFSLNIGVLKNFSSPVVQRLAAGQALSS